MKDFRPHRTNGYAFEEKRAQKCYYFNLEDDSPMWFDDTLFELSENVMTQEDIELARAENAPCAIDPVTGETIPAKYMPKGSHWCESKGWISAWRFEQPFEEIYPVEWEGFESNTHELKAMGWEIMLEYNRFTGRRKLCFRNFASGLMARVPFEFKMPYIQINKLYAVRNYKLKAATFTEMLNQFTDDMIPDMLEFIRNSYKGKVSEYIWSQKQKEAAEKVVELGKFLEDRRKQAA